jgi:hypothetical protein
LLTFIQSSPKFANKLLILLSFSIFSLIAFATSSVSLPFNHLLLSINHFFNFSTLLVSHQKLISIFVSSFLLESDLESDDEE